MAENLREDQLNELRRMKAEIESKIAEEEEAQYQTPVTIPPPPEDNYIEHITPEQQPPYPQPQPRRQSKPRYSQPPIPQYPPPYPQPRRQLPMLTYVQAATETLVEVKKIRLVCIGGLMLSLLLGFAAMSGQRMFMYAGIIIPLVFFFWFLIKSQQRIKYLSGKYNIR